MDIRKHLTKILLVSAVSFPAAAAAAPSITYSDGKDVFLTSPTGTGTVKVWSGPAKMAVSGIDFDPSGNRIAVLGTDRILRIVAYSNTGVAGTVTPIPTDNCIINGFDFHPSDGSLLVSRYCQSANSLEVRRYANGAYSAPLVTFGDPQSNAIGVTRWAPDGSSFFIGHATLSGSAIERHSIAIPSSFVTVWSGGNVALWSNFDVARCAGGVVTSSCSTILLTDGITLREIAYDDFGGSDQGVRVSNGVDGHYSPDNSEVAYKSQVRNGYQLKIAGATARTIVSKGSVGAIDWRP